MATSKSSRASRANRARKFTWEKGDVQIYKSAAEWRKAMKRREAKNSKKK